MLQSKILEHLQIYFDEESIKREYHLDNENIIDFLLFDSIGVEVKIKGQKRAIYKQCERYCKFEKLKQLILVTNVSIGFPKEINGKDCYILNLSKAWL